MFRVNQLLGRIISLPNTICNFCTLKSRKVHYGSNLRINGRVLIRGKGEIEFGNNVTINSSLTSNPIGGATKTTIHCIAGKIKIGSNVGISNAALVCRSGIVIEDWAKIGGNVKIYDNDFHSTDYRRRRESPDTDIRSLPVLIGEDAFIGAHSIILKGVHIGKRSIVAAGSVVTKNVPDDELWGGTPARYIKSL